MNELEYHAAEEVASDQFVVFTTCPYCWLSWLVFFEPDMRGRRCPRCGVYNPDYAWPEQPRPLRQQAPSA